MDTLDDTKIIPPEEHELMPARRRGDKVVNSWRNIVTDEMEFLGTANLIMTNQTGQQQQVPTNFPISNCKTTDEAFAAFDDAVALHVKLINAQAQMMADQAASQQRLVQRKRAIESAVTGIVRP